MPDKSKPAPTPRKGMNTRISDDLRAKLEAAAQENNRTVGNEIETRLRASFAGQDQRAMMREAMTEALIEIGTPRFISRFDPSSYDFKDAVWVLADGSLRRGKPDA